MIDGAQGPIEWNFFNRPNIMVIFGGFSWDTISLSVGDKRDVGLRIGLVGSSSAGKGESFSSLFVESELEFSGISHMF